jgi:hypothetical protein
MNRMRAKLKSLVCRLLVMKWGISVNLKMIFVSILAILSVGCAKGVDTSSTATPSQSVDPGSSTTPNPTQTKALFSQWQDSNGFVAIDLRQAAFGAQKPFVITTVTQQSCNCQVVTQGTDRSGTMQVSACAGNFSSGGLNCSSFNGAVQYTISSDSVLNFCQQSSGCTTFR